ncbi:MAG TPA: alpha/beta hydrolase [Rhodothermales bacterium]|nr:alpha/beta hydrolase [Rhodothermales bacterium]
MRRTALVVAAAAVALSGCAAVYAVGVSFVYSRADLPEANVRRGLPYVEGPTGAPVDNKNRLNLFLPLADSVRGARWPVVVFVHGGGWDTGDRDFTFGGADLYNNVGRFFASHGVGAAVVSYRLMPGVTWREQVADAARAVAWVHGHVADYGGDPDAVFVMGHSAGAHLITRVALDPAPLRDAGFGAGRLCGAIPVSGAALDLTDRETFLLEDNFDYYAARFAPDRVPLEEPPASPVPWQVDASPLPFARADAPPFLFIYAGGETRALQRQSQLLDTALRAAGARSRIVVAPGLSHTRIVPTLSRDDRPAGRAALAFVRDTPCG